MHEGGNQWLKFLVLAAVETARGDLCKVEDPLQLGSFQVQTKRRSLCVDDEYGRCLGAVQHMW
jgi:hypothetical protein